MERFNANSADCYVRTFKEGVLSVMGHDLKLRVGTFELERDGASLIRARFDASSFEVVAAIVNGREDGSALSQRDRDAIGLTIARDVLHADRFPNIEFVSNDIVQEASIARVRGTLTLHGVAREIEFEIRDGCRCHVVLDQRDFQMTPYRAPLGVLRVAPRVEVEISLR